MFMLARYKFVAKLLLGRRHVLEVGGGDAFGTRLVRESTGKVTAIGFDPQLAPTYASGPIRVGR